MILLNHVYYVFISLIVALTINLKTPETGLGPKLCVEYNTMVIRRLLLQIGADVYYNVYMEFANETLEYTYVYLRCKILPFAVLVSYSHMLVGGETP